MSTGSTHFLLPTIAYLLVANIKTDLARHYQPKIGSLDFDDLSTANAIHFNIVLARTRNPRYMQNCEHSCFFSTAHAAKDSGIALELARHLGLDLPRARATKEQYDRMIAEGLGDLDKSSIAELTFKDRRKHSGDRV